MPTPPPWSPDPMHDFLQNQSYCSSRSPFAGQRFASEILRSLTRSYNETPAYRPSPAKSRGVGAPRLQRRGVKSLSSQLSTLS